MGFLGAVYAVEVDFDVHGFGFAFGASLAGLGTEGMRAGSVFAFFSTASVEASPSRPQKFQKADPSVSTSLLHTQQYQVLLNALFCKISEPARSVFRKRTNRMFCVIIVPWAIVIVGRVR